MARTAGVAVRMVVVRMVVAEARYSYILKDLASRLAAVCDDWLITSQTLNKTVVIQIYCRPSLTQKQWCARVCRRGVGEKQRAA